MKRLLLLIIMTIALTGNIYSQTAWAPNGLHSYAVVSLAVNSKGHLFAGTKLRGIYRSLDKGKNWQRINKGIVNYLSEKITIPVIVITPKDYILISVIPDSRNSKSGVFLSVNNGDSWTNSGLGSQKVNRLVMTADGDIFAGTEDPETEGGAIFHSPDQGYNWNTVFETASPIRDIVLAGNNGLLAGTASGLIFNSKDNGATWKEISLVNRSTKPVELDQILYFSVLPQHHILIVVKQNIQFNETHFKTTSSVLYMTGKRHKSYSEIEYCFVRELFYPFREGKGYFSRSNDVYAFGYDAQGHIFTSTSRGVFHSKDCRNWVPAKQGLPKKTRIATFIVDKKGVVIAGTNRGIYQTTAK